MVKPLGPHHFASWFGSLKAPKTIGAAAGSRRVISSVRSAERAAIV